MDEVKNKSFPMGIRDVEPIIAEDLKSYLKGQQSGYVRAGPKGYFLPKKYEQNSDSFYNMPVRSSDVFVVTFPRSGTTWTQELVWLVANDCNYDKAAEIPLVARFPYMDRSIVFDPVIVKQFEEANMGYEDRIKYIRGAVAPATEQIAETPSPRFIKSHLPLSLLPPSLLDTAKVVYVARDPRDVAVSFFHHNRLFNILGYVGDFKRYWNYFINDMIYYTPFFEHVKEGWRNRHHPNMLFLFYDELIQDLPGTIRRVAEFLGKNITEPQIEGLLEHLNIGNFKKNKSVNGDILKDLGIVTPGEAMFIRSGKTGGWRGYFDADMTQQAERWMADNMRDTDLAFPQ